MVLVLETPEGGEGTVAQEIAVGWGQGNGISAVRGRCEHNLLMGRIWGLWIISTFPVCIVCWGVGHVLKEEVPVCRGGALFGGFSRAKCEPSLNWAGGAAR